MTDFKHLFKPLSRITLSDNERLSLRERLAAYSELHPATLTQGRAIPSGIFGIFASQRFSLYASGFAMLILAASGVSFAADGSVPGDVLYPIKTQVTEPLMIALAATNQAQANVASLIATRRVEEAVTLAGRGTLSPSTQTYLTERFSSQIALATTKADKLATEGDSNAAIEVKANLAANLAGQAEALGALSTDQVDGQRAATEQLLSKIIAESDSVTPEDTSAATAVAAGIVSTTTGSGEEGSTTTGTTSTGTTEAAGRAFGVGRFAHRLDITASTTFTGRLASTSVNAASFQNDSAVPSAGSLDANQNADSLESL